MKYLRRKGRWSNGESKYIIEENSQYIRTVPKVELLLELIRLDGIDTKPSQNNPKKERAEDKNFTQPLLNEPTSDEINRTLSEVTK